MSSLQTDRPRPLYTTKAARPYTPGTTICSKACLCIAELVLGVVCCQRAKQQCQLRNVQCFRDTVLLERVCRSRSFERATAQCSQPCFCRSETTKSVEITEIRLFRLRTYTSSAVYDRLNLDVCAFWHLSTAHRLQHMSTSANSHMREAQKPVPVC